MRELFSEIRQALDADLYFVALQAALTIPDHMAALDSPDLRTSGARYMKWFRDNVEADTYGFITAEECWHFRCTMLHEASTAQRKGRYRRIVFLEPSNVTIDQVAVHDVLIIDVPGFCEKVIGAAEAWLASEQSGTVVSENLGRVVQRRTEGPPEAVLPFKTSANFIY